ncbi:MarR family winged helix-turn-helix transcriptional regulator [Amycolatopsis anabasis]|uniref:MarR family winged helix-turn-helix transcriptional regulator n=1 Tax=Amycolatopsis anabasis TaxID=1840409 RepID=UPI001C555B21|nr:MarR family transcriptional regulator [Amycolatopsis anabasis]
MTAQPEQPDFWSFIDVAVERTARELPEVDLGAMRLVLTLHRLTSMLVYDVESAVHRPRGWSWPGFRVLFVLWLAGPAEPRRIAELSGMSRAAVSALTKTLERDGLVDRTPAEQDRRSVRLSLTEAGHDAITSAFTAHNEREQAWASTLSTSERETLTGLLEKMIAGPAAAVARRRA